jgi:hypothetical protein
MKDSSIKNILVSMMFSCATSYQILIDLPTVSRTVVYADRMEWRCILIAALLL